MASDTNSPKPAYGWRDFDQEVVEGLVENDSRFINRRSNGWIASPLAGHYDNKLAWKDDNFKKGSVPAGDPPVSFRAAPTYVLERPLDNFVAGRELIAEAIAGKWGNPEASRLGNETSVGALTWNVLRSLQEVDRLHVAAAALAATEIVAEPELGFWGRRIGTEQAEPWPALDGGPDACLRVPRWGWILIDARFGGGTDTLADAAAIEAWLEQYSSPAPGLFDEEPLRRVRVKDLPHRTLQTIAFAHHLRSDGEQAVVVALVRASESPQLERWVGRCLADTADVAFRRVTWESLFAALDADDGTLAPLCAYLENKSYGLHPAFALADEDDSEES
jgi:hypothetical protein